VHRVVPHDPGRAGSPGTAPLPVTRPPDGVG
jgi:hypothetical protein